ncbi:MAG: zinc ribbon domain-containing protein [Proteobacteria bacterium]|nr:zinc ribbon domain-containing protein [Pseudomonadota bacterium]
MPIYEYKCDRCDHRLEILQKINEDPAKSCPECGEESLRKLISAVAFKLKGTGWYETDFKDKKPEKETKNTNGEKKDTKKSSGSDSKKSDSSNKDASKTSKETSKSSSSDSSSK